MNWENQHYAAVRARFASNLFRNLTPNAHILTSWPPKSSSQEAAEYYLKSCHPLNDSEHRKEPDYVKEFEERMRALREWAQERQRK